MPSTTSLRAIYGIRPRSNLLPTRLRTRSITVGSWARLSRSLARPNQAAARSGVVPSPSPAAMRRKPSGTLRSPLATPKMSPSRLNTSSTATFTATFLKFKTTWPPSDITRSGWKTDSPESALDWEPSQVRGAPSLSRFLRQGGAFSSRLGRAHLDHYPTTLSFRAIRSRASDEDARRNPLWDSGQILCPLTRPRRRPANPAFQAKPFSCQRTGPEATKFSVEKLQKGCQRNRDGKINTLGTIPKMGIGDVRMGYLQVLMAFGNSKAGPPVRSRERQ